MIMRKLDDPWSFTIIFHGNFFYMFFAYFKKSHIYKRFKKNLTFHFIDSHRQIYSDSVLANDFNNFSLISKFFAFKFDLCSGWKARSNLRLHSIDDFEVLILWLTKSNSFSWVGKVSDLDSYFIVLIDFNIFKDHFSWYDLEWLWVDCVHFRVCLEWWHSWPRLHLIFIVSYIIPLKLLYILN